MYPPHIKFYVQRISILCVMCLLGFSAGWIFKDPFVNLLLGDRKSIRSATVTENRPPQIPLTPAQEEFWKYLEQFNRLPENPTEEMVAVYNTKGIAPEFHYLKASGKSVIGDIKGLTAHRDRFIKRYSWVQPLLDQYSIEIPISALRFSGTAEEIGEKYEKLMMVNWKCKATPENEKSYVTNYLEGLLVVDFVYACGTANDKRESMEIIDGVFEANMILHPFRKSLEKKFMAPASREIGWAVIADLPELTERMTRILVKNGFSEISPADRVSLRIWMLNTKALRQTENERDKELHQGMNHNDYVRVGLLDYAIFKLHTYEVVRPHDNPELVVIKILFKRLFPKDHAAQYQRYLTLLNNAYPKIKS